MSNRNNRENTLRLLFEDNFKVARSCRKTGQAVADVSLQYYFQNMASRRSQFALELANEIVYYGGKKPYSPSNAYEERWPDSLKENQLHYLKKAVRRNKASLQKYREALGQINDGSCREILLRHKAFIENSVFELKALKKLLKYSMSEKTSETTTH